MKKGALERSSNSPWRLESKVVLTITESPQGKRRRKYSHLIDEEAVKQRILKTESQVSWLPFTGVFGNGDKITPCILSFVKTLPCNKNCKIKLKLHPIQIFGIKKTLVVAVYSQQYYHSLESLCLSISDSISNGDLWNVFPPSGYCADF